MKAETKHKLFLAWAWCDEEDKSTAFMLQFMQDYAKVGLDTVNKFLMKTTDEERYNWYKENPDWYKTFEGKKYHELI